MRKQVVGIVGLGLVGSALAERFTASGLTLSVYDIRAEARDRFPESAAASAADVARQASRVVLSLPNSSISSEVVEEIQGDLQPGDLVLDTSTGDPDEMAATAGKLAAHEVEYLDATIAGSSEQVRQGRVLVLCGGSPHAFAASQDLLGLFSSHLFHLGPAGRGARMKLVFNLVLGLNRAALAEGLAYAEACGIDPARALAVLQTGPAYSRAMDRKGNKMLNREYTPEGRLSQHLKDVRLILKTGARSGARLPLSQVHRELLEEAEAAGWGAADNSAVIEVFRKEQP